MQTSRKTDFRSRDIAKNNFNGIDISQGLKLEPPSLSPYFPLEMYRNLKMHQQWHCFAQQTLFFIRLVLVARRGLP